MTAQNAELIRRAYQAFARGDVTAVFGILGPDITWHVPGSSPLSGDYKGHGQAGVLRRQPWSSPAGHSPSTSKASSPTRSGWLCCARSRRNASASRGRRRRACLASRGRPGRGPLRVPGRPPNRGQILEFSGTTMTSSGRPVCTAR